MRSSYFPLCPFMSLILLSGISVTNTLISCAIAMGLTGSYFVVTSRIQFPSMQKTSVVDVVK